MDQSMVSPLSLWRTMYYKDNRWCDLPDEVKMKTARATVTSCRDIVISCQLANTVQSRRAQQYATSDAVDSTTATLA